MVDGTISYQGPHTKRSWNGLGPFCHPPSTQWSMFHDLFVCGPWYYMGPSTINEIVYIFILYTFMPGIFLGTSQLAYRRQKLGRSPSPARGVRGHAPREFFEKSDAIICIFVYFKGHKIATWWLYFDVGGVCIEPESDLFSDRPGSWGGGGGG